MQLRPRVLELPSGPVRPHLAGPALGDHEAVLADGARLLGVRQGRTGVGALKRLMVLLRGHCGGGLQVGRVGGGSAEGQISEPAACRIAATPTPAPDQRVSKSDRGAFAEFANVGDRETGGASSAFSAASAAAPCRSGPLAWHGC
jgi:hypothetical protein